MQMEHKAKLATLAQPDDVTWTSIVHTHAWNGFMSSLINQIYETCEANFN